ncbi:MAG: tetratricopeptide repeat protein [Cyanobacteria bacterium J06649_4]
MSEPLLNHRYRILKALAEGGFGKTFLVEDVQMPSRRCCVVKQLKPMNHRLEVFQVVQQRFVREAAVLEAVGKGHRQIPDLYAYFEESGQFYLVQEWIEGAPLTVRSAADWSEARVRSLLTSLLHALSHVHQQNIIHRDIKPDNIILRNVDQLPCLIDFGAVKELMSTVVSASGSTRSSLVIGTPGYMPPEQAAGRPTFSSDLYSLGMTMVYLLTARSPAELPTNSLTGEVLWQQFAPTVSDRFANVLSRAIHPSVQTRYATASDMLAALPASALEQSPTATSTSNSTVSTVAVSPAVPRSVASQPAHAAIAQAVTMSPQQVAAVKASTPDYGTVSSSSVSSPDNSWLSKSRELPFKRIGLTLGAFLLAAGLWNSVRPRFSVDGNASMAETENFRATIDELTAAVAAEPNNQAATVALASALQEVGAYDQALAQLNPLLSESPDDVNALIEKGGVQMMTGDYAGAISTFSEAIAQNTSSATALIERGNAYYETGEYDKAIDDYRSALRVDPGNGQAYREWSSVNVAQGNTQESLQNLDLAIENGDTSISAYVNRGSRRAELGDRVGATEDWQTASKLSASTADEFASRGYAKSRLGNKQGAVDDYNQALIVNPNHVRSLVNRAYDFYESGEKQQALNTLEKALEINPNAVTALLLKGEINAFNNPADWESVIAAYSQALAVNPNEPGVLNNRCSAYFAVAQLDKALEDCNLGLQINPRSASLYTSRGNIYLRQENYNSAIRDFSRTIELSDEIGGDPRRQATAYSNRASALVNVQDLNGALSDLDKALELNPGDAPDLYKRGIVKATLGDKDSARIDLRKAADIYIQQGRTESHQSVLAMIEQLGLQ